MTPKKVIVKCTNIVMTEQNSSVQFSTELKPVHKNPSPSIAPVTTLFAIQFDKATDAKQFDMGNLYEITIADKK